MDKERAGKTREPQPDEREPRERTAAPPIEREHETQQGVVEEDERRKQMEKRGDREKSGNRS